VEENTGVVEAELEEAVIGSILLSPMLLRDVLSEAKLEPRHFSITRNHEVYAVILRLHEKGMVPDVELVSSHLAGTSATREWVKSITSIPLVPERVLDYARRVVELSQWRDRKIAAVRSMEAINKRDLIEYAKARSFADQELTSQDSFRSTKELAKQFRDYLDQAASETIKLPFAKLNDLLMGGFRRKQVTIIGGWTSHGKSILTDQFLNYFSQSGYNCHLYINEMAAEERVARIVMRETGISYKKIINNNLSDDEQNLVNLVLDNLPFPITECAGWTIDEFVFDIKRHDFDVVAIDILHQFDYDSEIELSRVSRFLNRVSKTANCHILATVHLNEARATDSRRPRPVNRDIRGSGMIKNDADNVMFLFREQDPTTYNPIHTGSIYFTKVRNGNLGSMPVVFNDQFLSFEEIEDFTSAEH
jgi:replicative DNA helicase